MHLVTRTVLSRALLAGLVLSFVGAKGCLGGEVSLGSVGAAGTAGMADTSSGGSGNATSTGGSSGLVSGGAGGRTALDPSCRIPPLNPGCHVLSIGYNYDPVQGKCVQYCANNAIFSTLDACQATCESPGNGGGGSAGTGATEAPLSVDANGRVTSSAELEVAGPFYPYSDGAGTDGASAGGDCENAGHTPAQCANVALPPYGPSNVVEWGLGGLMCTSGTVEGVIDVVGQPGVSDYASMWGAGVGFNLSETHLSYDASAHGVIGIAFDIDRVPERGVRVEMPTATTPDEARAWKASQNSNQGLVSPVQVGHNVVLFQDMAPLTFYADQSAFDPTQLVAVQFHVPTSTSPSNYAFCIRSLSLVLGTPPDPTIPNNGACSPSLETDSGFAYNAGQACVSPYSTVLGCSPADDPAMTVPAAPAVPNLPCARRLSDGALFIALGSGAQPLDWQTLPASAWSHLSTKAWAECTADEAALVGAAPVCPIIPL